MGMCQIYKNNTQFIVSSMHKSNIGIRFSSEDRRVIPLDSELDNIINEAIQESKTGLEMPADPKKIQKGLLDIAGCKNWKSFFNAYDLIGVENSGEKYKITNYKKGENQAYFPAGSIECQADKVGITVKSMINKSDG